MKKYMAAAALLLLMGGCKKDVNETQNNQPKNMPVQGINIVNGMLSFDKAEFYDTFVSRSDGQVLDALRLYEESNDYLSLAEQREWAEDTVYTEVISSLLNTDYMIHIENKLYRINAHTGYVYTLSAEYLNDNAAITALRNEDLGDDRISRHSVEEDLWEISGLPQPKSGPGGGCPTVVQYNGPDKVLSDNRYSAHLGFNGCVTGQISNLTVVAQARYRRYGVRFELYVHGWEFVANNQKDFSCNQIKFEIPTVTYRQKGSQTVYGPHSINPTDAPGGVDPKVVFYRGPSRLCYFYLVARVGSMKGWPNYHFTPFVSVRFNFTP